MDPSRTLMAFLLVTDPSATTVQLIGSWDNFSSCYPMDRDARRGRGHWRGCHSLKHVVCDDSGSRYKTHTGLAMGHTYYYYYEINGSTEMCDPSKPSTTSCPYLPGQTVNILYIPEERPSRQRRASLSSLSKEHLQTMDPRSKFATPQPAPASHAELSIRRTGTAVPAVSTLTTLSQEQLDSPISPTRAYWKRFFHKTLISRSSESRGRSLASASSNVDIRPQTSSDGSRSRDEISPDSLRRFLSEGTDTLTRPVSRGSRPSNHPGTPTFDSLDQLDEEDDDDNFIGATGGASIYTMEEPAFTTRLSPPPFKRGTSPATATSSSAQTVVPSPRERPSTLQTDNGATAGLVISPVPRYSFIQLSEPKSPTLSILDTCAHSSTCPSSTVSSAMNSPASPTSSGAFPSFYLDSHDDDCIDEHFPFSGLDEETGAASVTGADSRHLKTLSTASFSRYRLPELTCTSNKPETASVGLSSSPRFTTVNSPLLLARGDEGAVGDNDGGNLLGSSIDMGLDDFASELSWMAASITTGH